MRGLIQPISLTLALFSCILVRIFPGCETPFLGTTAVKSVSCSLETLVHSSKDPCLRRAPSQHYLLPGARLPRKSGVEGGTPC